MVRKDIRLKDGNITSNRRINDNFEYLWSIAGCSVKNITQKSSDYTITDIDEVYTLEVTTSTNDITITLPTSSANEGRVLNIAKVDSGSGDVIVDGEGSETISGDTTKTIDTQWTNITIQCNGTSWLII